MLVYEVNPYPDPRREFESKDEARAFAEQYGHASLITWAVHPNLPNAKPDQVYKSCSLDVWENGKWRGVNIHGGW